MNTFIILLRSINITGKNKIRMAALRDSLTNAGLEDVRTYIQSGNIVAASNLSQSNLEHLVNAAIKQDFGADIKVFARTAAQFHEIYERNPFIESEKSSQYFSLLASPPDSDLLKNLLSIDFSPDQVRFIDDTIYTLYQTKYSDSKFNNNFYERKLKTAATTRNFNTMTKLVELSSI